MQGGSFLLHHVYFIINEAKNVTGSAFFFLDFFVLESYLASTPKEMLSLSLTML